MAMSVQEQSHIVTSILDLPYQVIMHICSDYALTTTDIYNLAISHSKLNDYLFGEQNSSFWKTKYKQKYDHPNFNIFKIAITDHSNWRNEIMLRMTLNKSVQREIMQMPSKYLRLKNIPYHVYPFGDELNSNKQNCQYYVYRSSLDFYKHMFNQRPRQNQDVLYMAHQFLKYASKVFFGYMIQEFLRFPQAIQTIERGFYLLGCWWCPTNIVPYNDIRDNLDAITFVMYNRLYSKQPLHPMFENGYDFDSIIRNGNCNLDHDLYNEADSLRILGLINKYIFRDMKLVCPCHHTDNCILLENALYTDIGPRFIVGVLYESIARRLGVRVGLISTYHETSLTWTPSWPGEVNTDEKTFSIYIPKTLRAQTTMIFPAYGNCTPTSVPDLMVIFSRMNSEITVSSSDFYRNTLYFEKLLKPEDTIVQSRFRAFYQFHEFCPCPLIRTPLNPIAPKHKYKKCNLYVNWEDIFPLEPKRRGTNNDPFFSIGMLVKTFTTNDHIQNSGGTMVKYGIIVGWSKILFTDWREYIVYYVLYKPHPQKDLDTYLIPDIEPVYQHSNVLRRHLEEYNFTFNNMGKYFKYYNLQLYACIPIDALAECYPDDFTHTVNNSRNV